MAGTPSAETFKLTSGAEDTFRASTLMRSSSIVTWNTAIQLQQAGDPVCDFLTNNGLVFTALVLQHFSSSLTFVEKLSLIFYDECTLNLLPSLKAAPLRRQR